MKPVDYTKLEWWERKAKREEYVEFQKGLCYFCKEPLSGKPSKSVLNKRLNKRLFPKTFFQYPVHLHHSHDTGLTIGAVHSRCNAVLWQYHGE